MSIREACPKCGKLRAVSKAGTGMLCKACRGQAVRARETVPCTQCGAPTELEGKALSKYRSRGRAYCSIACGKAYASAASSETMAATNRVHASERMKQHNPMHDPSTRAKVSDTLQQMGHRPPVQAGNGRGPTVPQERLARALGWPMEVPIATGIERGKGYPTAYKVDIGDPSLKIAIEVDGRSHCSLARQAEDAKKEALLASLGWTVLRFWNEAVMQDLNACVQTVRSTISKSTNSTPTPPMA